MCVRGSGRAVLACKDLPSHLHRVGETEAGGDVTAAQLGAAQGEVSMEGRRTLGSPRASPSGAGPFSSPSSGSSGRRSSEVPARPEGRGRCGETVAAPLVLGDPPQGGCRDARTGGRGPGAAARVAAPVPRRHCPAQRPDWPRRTRAGSPARLQMRKLRQAGRTPRDSADYPRGSAGGSGCPERQKAQCFICCTRLMEYHCAGRNDEGDHFREDLP